MAARFAEEARREALHRMAAVAHARRSAKAETRRNLRSRRRNLAGEPCSSGGISPCAYATRKGLRAPGRDRRTERLGLVPARPRARPPAFELRRDAYRIQQRRAGF